MSTRRADDDTPESWHVGQRLATARMMRGLAQVELARRAQVAPSYLSRVETGKVQPTFRSVMHIAGAMGAELSEIVGPDTPGELRRQCPVTAKGQCLLDLVAQEADHERYSPREIRLLRRFAAWIKTAQSDRVRAIEVLLDDLMSATGAP